MAESIHNQLTTAIETSLRAISGDNGATYHYSPGAVTRSWPAPDEPEVNLLDPSIQGPIYAIRAGEEVHTEELGGVVAVVAPLSILLAFRYDEVDLPHQPATVSRATVVDRMVRDVLKKLLADVQLGAFSVGGLVENVFAQPATVDRDRFVVGWALAEIAFAASYRYTDGTP